MAAGGGHWGQHSRGKESGLWAPFSRPPHFSRALCQGWVAFSRSPGRAGAKTQMLGFQL